MDRGSIPALKAIVNQYIKANGKQEITGPVANSVLMDLIDTLNAMFPTSPVTGTFTAAQLNAQGQFPVTHNLGTDTPDVKLWDPNGVQLFELNSGIQNININQTLITVVGAVQGNYRYEIKVNDFIPDPVPGTFTDTQLDGNGEITITHNLGTSTPDVKLWDPDGIQMFEVNSKIQNISTSQTRFTIISPKVGTYKYMIKTNII